MKKNENGKAIVRDLMKPIYDFGRHDFRQGFVTRLEDARARVEAGESFYVFTGGSVIYHVLPAFYKQAGIPLSKVTERLSALLMPPEAVGL